MSVLGVVVSLARWRAIVHYTDCPSYLASTQRHVPIPARMKVRVCQLCRPTAEDLYRHTPDVEWYEYSPAPMAGVKVREVNLNTEHAEHVAGRHSLGIGKVQSRGTGLSR